MELCPHNSLALFAKKQLSMMGLQTMMVLNRASLGLQYLLRVAGAAEAGKVGVGVYSAQKDGLVLVHARVCEEQGGVVVGDHCTAGHKRVALGLEELAERRTHTSACESTTSIVRAAVIASRNSRNVSDMQ